MKKIEIKHHWNDTVLYTTGVDDDDRGPSEAGGSGAQREAARAARYRARYPDVPVVPNLDGRILALVEGGAGRLEMKDWHTCETTHCRAGWAIVLAGEAGYELERRFGPVVAGGMIYHASVGRIPNFYDDNAAALRDIRECAARDAALAAGVRASVKMIRW